MSDKLIDQLKRLSEVAPDVCRKDGDEFIIGGYRFFVYDSPGFGFMAEANTNETTHIVSGRPALAWLEDALRSVIEARGWRPGTVLSKDRGWIGQAANDYGFNIVEDCDTPAEALLAALIAALEER